MACKYIINGKSYTEQELKEYLLSGGLDELVKDNTLDLSKIKPTEYAIQEPSAGGVLQYPQEGVGEAGGERRGVEQRIKGEEITKEGKPKGDEEKVNDFLYKGSAKQRKLGLLKNLMSAEGIPESYKEGLEKKGLNYEVSNQFEASEIAKGIIKNLGVNDALQIARSSEVGVDPSVGSAIFAESINTLWSEERSARGKGNAEEANALAEQWADTSIEYARLANSGGKWNSQIAYFYKNSPLGFVKTIEKQNEQYFQDFYSTKEKNFKEVFDEILSSEEGKALFDEKVEAKLSEERKEIRKARDKKIDEFFESAKLKGGTYATIIPPQVWNGAMEVLKVATKGGDRIIDAIDKAILYIDKELKGQAWDKDKFRKEYTESLSKVADGGKTESDLLQNRIKSLESKIKDYEKRISAGGVPSKKPTDKFEDNAEVKNLRSQIDELRKENESLLKKKQEGRYSREAKITAAEKRALKNIEELEKKLENNDLEISKAEELSSPNLNELKSKAKKLRDELEERRKVAGIGKYSDEAIADAEINRKKNRIKELERRIEEGDFSSERYKAKKEKDALDDELADVKSRYDEARKKSEEYIEKKGKQYLDRLSKRMNGMTADQKNRLIRSSLKKITETGGLNYDQFKDLVAESIGIKKLSLEQQNKIEELSALTNIPDDLEQQFLNNPTAESIKKYKEAKKNSLEAEKELFDMTHNEADITGTLRSIMTLNLLGAPTLIKNYGQNLVYQATVRFPSAVAIKTADAAVYGVTSLLNKVLGTKVIKPSVSLRKGNEGYWKEYREGVIRGWDQMIKGVEERDYFSKNQYSSNLNPRKAYKDLMAASKGEIFLTKAQKIDKLIQVSIGWQPYAIARGMMYGDKPPRYAAQGAEAMQIGHMELGISDPFELEAFMLAPEKYAYNNLLKTGKTAEEASKLAANISERIVQAGAKATFQNENILNDIIKKLDEGFTVQEGDNIGKKLVKPPLALLKATQLPFVKTPANIVWTYVKVANPVFTSVKSLAELGFAQNALKKGDLLAYKKYQTSAKESFGFALAGFAISTAAAALIEKDLVRPRYQSEEDKARESAGESFFGKDNQVNLGKLLNSEDFWVDLSWFGPVGSILDQQARMAENKKERALKGEDVDDNTAEFLLNNFNYSVTSSLNTLLLDQGAKLIDGIRKGGDLGVGMANNIMNSVSNLTPITGGTLASLSKALQPEKTTAQADGIVDQVINSQKQRNIFLAWASGYAPSKISMWGEPIKNDRSVTGVLGNMLGFEKGNENKFGAILYDDQRRTADNRFFPPIEDKKIKVNGKDVELSPEEKQWLDIFVGQQRKALVAPFIYGKAEIPGFDQRYPQMDDATKIQALDVLYKLGKEGGIAKFKEKYKQYQDAEITFEQKMAAKELERKKRLLKMGAQ